MQMTEHDRRFFALLGERLGDQYQWVGDELFAKYGFRLFARAGGPGAIKTYGVHHSVGGETADAISHYHRYGRDWLTPGYHVFVRRDGTVEGLVPPGYAMSWGAGPFNNPTCAYVCCAGNYEADTPRSAMLQSLYVVLCTYDDIFGSHPWRAHRELPRTTTACCGTKLLWHLSRMRGPDYGARVPRPETYP